jgi:Flp pilus assembly protein TadG
MRLPRLVHDQRGVTLIDLILVIIITSLAVPPMVALLSHVTRESTFGVAVTRANHLASTLLEEVRSKRWDENTGAASATLGSETGETRATYDDESPPKDSLGTTMSGVTGFRQQVSVCYVANTDLNTCLGSGTSNYKQVTVTLTDPEGRASQMVTVLSSF